MESELEYDLLEAFEGADPIEFIAEDPILSSLMLDVISDESSETNNKDDNENILRGTGFRSGEDPNICSVCKGPSKGNRYYGAIACTSCRSFFGRAIKEEAYKDFLCAEGLLEGFACKIDSKSWMSCQLCRFKQCLNAGMKIPSLTSTAVAASADADAIDVTTTVLTTISAAAGSTTTAATGTSSLTNITAISASTAAETKVATLNKPKKDLTPLINIIKHCIFPSYMLDETLNIDKLTRLPLEVGTKVITSLCHSNASIFPEMMDFTFLGKMYPTRTRKQISDSLKFFGIQIYVNDSSGGPFGLGEMSKMDKLRLANGNIPLVTEYALANRIGKRPDENFEANGYIDSLARDPDQDFSRRIKDICSTYSKASKNGALKPAAMTYEDAYSPEELGLRSKEALERHRKSAMRLSQVEMGGGDTGDPIITMLTVFIILNTPDFLDLDEPEKAEDAQAMWAGMLQRYLKKKDCSNRDLVFRNSMLASSYARELNEFQIKAYQRLKV